jgi:hypothetical protein
MNNIKIIIKDKLLIVFASAKDLFINLHSDLENLINKCNNDIATS